MLNCFLGSRGWGRAEVGREGGWGRGDECAFEPVRILARTNPHVNAQTHLIYTEFCGFWDGYKLSSATHVSAGRNTHAADKYP